MRGSHSNPQRFPRTRNDADTTVPGYPIRRSPDTDLQKLESPPLNQAEPIVTLWIAILAGRVTVIPGERKLRRSDQANPIQTILNQSDRKKTHFSDVAPPNSDVGFRWTMTQACVMTTYHTSLAENLHVADKFTRLEQQPQSFDWNQPKIVSRTRQRLRFLRGPSSLAGYGVGTLRKTSIRKFPLGAFRSRP